MATTMPDRGCLAVVQRGKVSTFQTLQDRFGRWDVVAVLWDRRTQERRKLNEPASVERRREERRRVPPYTWKTLGFVLVVDGQVAAAAQADEHRGRNGDANVPPPAGA